MKKNFKKIAAVALSCVLTLGMSLNAFAANYDTTTKDLIDSRGDDTPAAAKDGMTNCYTSFDTTKTSSRDVTVKIVRADVYRVDVAWEATKFTFKFDEEWVPETHTYGDDNSGKFYIGDTSTVKDNAKITVTNHSNAAVDITYGYTDKTTNGFSANVYDGTGSSKTIKSTGTIENAEINSFAAPGSAPTDIAYIVVSGTPTTRLATSDVVIGTLTVTISKKTN